ncbi:FAD-dependent monooxygenase [Streptomyces sp. NPDC096176]|uniref:FAD-dependent monooxygenase n=1 Tax=Streptomyces sp. NPDC096176 TaxID=3366079 RepID=UPI0038085007
MAQIRMDHWSRGRVALLGDADHCPSPLSGQGTSPTLVGAHVLAACLAQADGDHRSAYSHYEQRMRLFVTLNQALAPTVPAGLPPRRLSHAPRTDSHWTADPAIASGGQVRRATDAPRRTARRNA